MEILVCGSGDAVGIPGIFCDCRVCRNSRQVGGFEFRSRTNYLLDNSIKFDFSPDLLMQSHRWGFNLCHIEQLFLTHTHSDHLYPEDFWTHSLGALGETAKEITIYSSIAGCEYLKNYPGINIEKYGFKIESLQDNHQVKCGNYFVTPLKTKHICTEDCFIYLIEGDKRLLIANDSDFFPEQVFKNLQNKLLDCIFIDCTWGLKKRENMGHMGLPAIQELLARLKALNCVHSLSQIYLTHISHKADITHGELVEYLEKSENIHVAYDGMKLKI